MIGGAGKIAGGRIAVLDVGKTNLKVVLVDAATLEEVAVRRAPNRPRPGPSYPHADVEAQAAFFVDALRDLAGDAPISAVSISAHGATAALVDDAGALVLPVLDYEHDGPDEDAAAYDAVRPPFAETGSPRLPGGLNLGAQLFWLERRFPKDFARARHLLAWPQYWAHRLCGVAASEATSLGCHTDLWAVDAGRPSSLARARGWDRLLPPLRRANEALGPIRPEIAAATGLAPDVPVFCGLHDSNASLLPHLASCAAPFAVVSTGTWVVVMAIGGGRVTLDPARDTLVNVNAYGEPVPSARFMGGREYEIVRAGRDWSEAASAPTDRDHARVRESGLMLLPAVQPGCGPYPQVRSRWTATPHSEAAERVALSWYLALTTATCLDLVGAAGPILVEGPFSSNPDYLAMLASATGRPVHGAEGHVSGTSVGAALAALGDEAPPLASPGPSDLPDPALAAYAAAWRERVTAGDS